MPAKKQNDLAQKKKFPWYFYLVLILIPIFFFLLLEISLRIFGYGKDIPQWIDARRGKYIINPDVSYRYFNNVQNIPTTIEDVFDQKKKKNSFRVFVLGGSSAAGFPYMPMGSFSRYLRKRLELTYPNTNVEVVNVGLSAVNSYTILNLLPGVLEQDPDLILIYAGHNEYYGALGVGSMESLGTSRNFVNLVLYLNKYKTIQLIRNAITRALSLFVSADEEVSSGTLMSRMAKDQYIPLNSDKFNEGIEQFEGNLRDILELIKNKNVPVIVGKLVSNLKDQKPFISIKNEPLPMADQVYTSAQSELKAGNNTKSDSLFRLAKDLDALRFRAPEKINKIIENLCMEYNAVSVSIDSVFNSASESGIVGDNLMTDHLHPNIEGYHLIGNSFYEAMQRAGYLPKTDQPVISFNKQDSLTRKYFVFTDLDSTIGNYRITLLKNDWPFISKGEKKQVGNLLKPENFIDSIALDYMNNKISWEICHLNAAKIYLDRNNLEGYLKHMNILIYQYPIVVEYYDQVSFALLQREEFDRALIYLHKRYKIEPGDFSAKWIGTISLNKGNIDDAILYLNKAHDLNPDDAQVLYNLAGAYSMKKDYETAIITINKCLKINPGYPGANNLKQQLNQAAYNQIGK